MEPLFFLGLADQWWPFAVLAICVAVVIVGITIVRLHAFIALILAAIVAGLLSEVLPGEPAGSHAVLAVELTATAFGTTAGQIGIVIALASLIGMFLMESGAADKVVRRFIAVFGERRAGWAIFVGGFLLSIPIFFDTFFMLLLPLAVALRMRTGKDYLLYVLAICCAGAITHSLVAPHPGPLTLAAIMKIDLGLTIMVGLAAAIIPATTAWLVSLRLNARMDIPLRQTPGVSMERLQEVANKPESELPGFLEAMFPVILPIALISLASTFTAIQARGVSAVDVKDPGALVAAATDPGNPVSKVLQPKWSARTRRELEARTAGTDPSVVLVNALLGDVNAAVKGTALFDSNQLNGVALRPATRALLAAKPQADNLTRLNRMIVEDAWPKALEARTGMNPTVASIGNFLGNRNVALFIGAALAGLTVLRQKKGLTFARLSEMMGAPLETAGVIILITSAGGAFGYMLRNAGVGDAVKAAVAGHEFNLILLAYLVAAVVRVAQGSATVAMITAGTMTYDIFAGQQLPYNPVYIFCAIGFGSMILSWMNDSGFWVVSKLSGMTEKEALRSWTVIITVASVTGLITCLLFSRLLPLV
jgi:GntP family gluconate:H+ symporter